MLDTKTEPKLENVSREQTESDRASISPELPRRHHRAASRLWIIRLVLTLGVVALAIPLALSAWRTYMGAPWTRDGTVRAYVVTLAPEVAGRIVELSVVDNQFVHKGDVLMVIDPTDYEIAVKLAEAAVIQAKADAQNKAAQSQRRRQLNDLAASIEEKQTFATGAVGADATYRQANANLQQARVNLERTRLRAPVNGYVTNLLARLGNYATVGQRNISIVDSDSYWIDGYFEETNLWPIREGDPASAKPMGTDKVIEGHVDSIARAINVANAQPDQTGLALVNPIFTWVRLAQRVPVRIHIDRVPDGVRLVAGTTVTVQINPRPRHPSN